MQEITEWLPSEALDKTNNKEDKYWKTVSSEWSDLSRDNAEQHVLKVDWFWAKVFILRDFLDCKQFRQLGGIIKCDLCLCEIRARALHTDT